MEIFSAPSSIQNSVKPDNICYMLSAINLLRFSADAVTEKRRAARHQFNKKMQHLNQEATRSAAYRWHECAIGPRLKKLSGRKSGVSAEGARH
jgi:hypothetical protein